jgi:hypothetical protein
MPKKEPSPYPKIDALRKKFDTDKPLSLREACFVLWAEKGICSAQYLMFAYWIKQNKLYNSKLRWKLWYGMFSAFAEHDYPKMRDNIDLVVKSRKLFDKSTK